MRAAFVNTLTSLMREHEDIVTITPDMGFSVFEEMEREFPERFFNTGVTEQSTLGLAAGLSMSGYKVFVYAQSIFLSLRSFEQVRLDLAYHKANVKIIGTAAGFWLSQLGTSHFALEDVGAMRILPGMTIFSPGDPMESSWATRKAYETEGTVYMRIGKPDREVIHPKEITAQVGEFLEIQKGEGNLILSTGGMLPTALEAAKALEKTGVSVSVYSAPTIKPLSDDSVDGIFRKYHHIFTVEEHSVLGGLGTELAEKIVEKNIKNVQLVKFGVPDEFFHITGSRQYLLEKSGLAPGYISKKIKEILK